MGTATLRLPPWIELYREEIKRIAGKRHARNIRLFGSQARGEAGPDSDVDLLVSFDETASLLDQVALMYDLEDLSKRKTDVVSDRGLTDVFRKSIENEVVPL